MAVLRKYVKTVPHAQGFIKGFSWLERMDKGRERKRGRKRRRSGRGRERQAVPIASKEEHSQSPPLDALTRETAINTEDDDHHHFHHAFPLNTFHCDFLKVTVTSSLQYCQY